MKWFDIWESKCSLSVQVGNCIRFHVEESSNGTLQLEKQIRLYTRRNVYLSPV